MKIFEWSSKTNFVDEANVFVGFDSVACCCEDFGWYLTTEAPTQCTCAVGPEGIDPEGLFFDPAYVQDVPCSRADEGGAVAFRLTRPGTDPLEVVYLVLYNHHNGYYGHGFEFTVGGTTVREGML